MLRAVPWYELRICKAQCMSAKLSRAAFVKISQSLQCPSQPKIMIGHARRGVLLWLGLANGLCPYPHCRLRFTSDNLSEAYCCMTPLGVYPRLGLLPLWHTGTASANLILSPEVRIWEEKTINITHIKEVGGRVASEAYRGDLGKSQDIRDIPT